MATRYSPKIVSDGLILYVDAANPKSYTNGSSTLYDLSGYGSNLTINGSPSVTTLGGARCFRLTAVGQNFRGTLNAAQPSTDATIETWIYPESEVQADDRGCLLLISGGSAIYMSWNKSSQQMSNYWYSHPTEGYWESGAAVNRNAWASFTCVWNNGAGVAYQWTNGVKTTSGGTAGNAGPGTSITIGQEGGGRQFAGGIAFMRMYNRALSDSEVSQNYNVTKKRFGL